MTIKLKLFAYTLAHYYLCFSHLDKTINLYLRSRSAQLISEIAIEIFRVIPQNARLVH